MKHPLQIIGLQPGSLEPALSAEKIIIEADILSGGKRLLNAFPQFKGEKLAFISPVNSYAKELLKLMQEDKKVVLLADGDPLLFGIGQSLIPLIGEKNVRVTPAPSTVQIAAARLGKSWKDFKIISLHGRDDFFPLYAALQQGHSCAVYTDKDNTPSVIAKKLLERGVENYHMTVLAELGTDLEKITQGNLENFSEFNCADLNMVILTAENREINNQTFGRDDDNFIRQKGLITKLPARATGLALLDLRKDQTVWDLGAGCGSVAIEGSFIAGYSRFFAVEKDPQRMEMIKKNIHNFNAWTVTPVEGTMPEVLAKLPDPDRIFMGGGIGRDDSVIKEAAKRLKPGGRIVIHTILMGSIQRTRETFDLLGWQWQAMQLQASTSEKLVGDIRFKAQNPITIIWADKPAGQ